jgi:hypothetical protein
MRNVGCVGLAHKVGIVLRRFVLPASVKRWTLTTLPETMIKLGAKMVQRARFVAFQLAAVAILGRLYEAILDRISRFTPTPTSTHRLREPVLWGNVFVSKEARMSTWVNPRWDRPSARTKRLQQG